MARKRKQPKWPPVLFVGELVGGFVYQPGLIDRRVSETEEGARHTVSDTKDERWAVEPYVSLTALNKLLATRDIDPIKITEDDDGKEGTETSRDSEGSADADRRHASPDDGAKAEQR